MAKKRSQQLSLWSRGQKSSGPHTLYLRKAGDFEGLISGFHSIKAVSYVASPSLMYSIFDKYGFRSMEILVGENISMQSYKRDLESRQIGFIQQLMNLVREGRLSVYFPSSKTVHSKLYILESQETQRVIVGSANFSETASKAVRQQNYVVYWDFPDSTDPLLKRFRQDYQEHLKYSKRFLDDLLKLAESREESEETVIRTWLSQDVGQVRDIVESETSRILADLSRQALESEDEAGGEPLEDPVDSDHPDQEDVCVVIPSDAKTRESIEKKLQPLSPTISKSELRLKRKDFSEYVRKTCGVPLMGIDKERRRVRLHTGDRILERSAAPENGRELAEGLRHIEEYVESYEFGESINPRRVKMNVFEALLYVLSTPFAHEFKRMKKQVDMYSRGPSYLYLYGPSFNGKTNFLRFCLKVITGQHLEPIPQEYFNKTRIMNARHVGTVFPLLFDDVQIPSGSNLETVLKNYWEVWWDAGHPVPQIVMTTNRFNPPEWANTRIKRINFDVKFDQKNIRASETLNRLLMQETGFFKWFAHGYLERLGQPAEAIKEDLLVDELSLARRIVTELYARAGRDLPDYFPDQPVERVYDIDKMEWLELFEAGALWQEEMANKIIVQAEKTVHTYEVDRYMRLLPQGVKAKRKGHAIVIEGKDKYLEWASTGEERQGFWRQLARRLRRGGASR
jgi:hypothetical protein